MSYSFNPILGRRRENVRAALCEDAVEMAKQWFRRLICRHRRWHKDPPPGGMHFGTTRFVCLDCGKHRYFDPLNYPINYPLEAPR